MSKKVTKKQNRTVLIERFEIEGAVFAKDINTGEQGVFLSLKQFTQIQDALTRAGLQRISSTGGGNSGKARRAKAEMGWQSHALELAT